LQYGKDARVRKLAQAVIKAQTAEIAQMRSWKAQMEKANPSLKATPLPSPCKRWRWGRWSTWDISKKRGLTPAAPAHLYIYT
jgi:hypothetical protein